MHLVLYYYPGKMATRHLSLKLWCRYQIYQYYFPMIQMVFADSVQCWPLTALAYSHSSICFSWASCLSNSFHSEQNVPERSKRCWNCPWRCSSPTPIVVSHGHYYLPNCRLQNAFALLSGVAACSGCLRVRCRCSWFHSNSDFGLMSDRWYDHWSHSDYYSNE